jgi:hypothetical protein
MRRRNGPSDAPVCLRAFEVAPYPPDPKINRVTGQKMLSDEWADLLGYANVGNLGDPVESFSVAGYEWSQPVPWR